jgi:hypothetical protein
MRKAVSVSILCVLSVLFSGCIVVSSNKTQPASKHECPKHPQSVYSPEVKATMAEIDAVSKLASHSARANVLKAIARRPGLAPEERIHLTKAVSLLASHSDREEVLMILANNHPPVVQPLPKHKTCIPKEISTGEGKAKSCEE